jgi:hypothetical protein
MQLTTQNKPPNPWGSLGLAAFFWFAHKYLFSGNMIWRYAMAIAGWGSLWISIVDIKKNIKSLKDRANAGT